MLPGYDADGAIVISWGSLYKMTWEFFSTYVDEVYDITDASWARSKFAADRKLKLSGGLSEADLVNQMRDL